MPKFRDRKIMQVHLNQSSKILAANLISDSHIISKFFINNSGFLVIAVESPIANSQELTSDTIIGPISFTVVGHFESDGHCYAIVKTHNIAEGVDPSLINILTGRELQIAALVALGWSNKKVANQLQISEWTVSAHLRRIFIKLKVDSRSAMVYRCASLINRLHELRTIQGQMSSTSQPEDVAKSTTNEQTLQYEMAEIDRLLSFVATSSLTSQ
ncbi:MAG: helix-turn-helix transcriptional regulator [Nostoc sp. S4]|nr:helix-turn-helix transcriptional regulator [Nostoc sp. S4]